jgi:glycosyltransferase involved in cell wall biosynthesis
MNRHNHIRSVHAVSSLTNEFQGLSTAVATWCRNLAKLGDDVHVVSASLPIGSPPISVTPANSIRVQPSKLSGILAAHSWKLKNQLTPLIKNADIVHVHGLWHHPGYIAAQLATKYEKPLVISPHGEILPVAMNIHSFRKLVYLRFRTRKFFAAAAGFHALTAIEENAVLQNFPNMTTAMIPNGIEPVEPISHGAVGLANSLWPKLVDRTVILFMGRIHEIKGIDLLLKALKMAIRENSNIRLLIAGNDFGAEEALRRLSSELGIENQVVWAGHLHGREKEAALAVSDISVLPSKSDVVGLATLEAMQAGIPVIITEECGGDIVAEEGAGIIVESTPEQMADTINQLADNHELSRKMGNRGKQTVATHFGAEASAIGMNSFYSSIIEQRIQMRPSC